MALFGRRKVEDPEAREELAALRAELARMGSVLRQLETEQGVMHDQVRKWMRRAVAAERAAERNQESLIPEATITPAPSRQPWGARARIAARRAGIRLPSLTSADNGAAPEGE